MAQMPCSDYTDTEADAKVNGQMCLFFFNTEIFFGNHQE
jgi:hypothetical protein